MKKKDKVYKKGDLVNVYSLQSFDYGGFLDGDKAVVRQDSKSKSIFLCVVRNIGGAYKVDLSYEVYKEQVKPYKKKRAPEVKCKKANKLLKKVRKILLENKCIDEITKYESCYNK